MALAPTQLLKPLLMNEHWGLMEQYLAGEKTRLVTQLCSCNDINEVKSLQGQIKALEQILKLKEQSRIEQGSKR